jgi:uncharacterized membrane protein HdeD (DUF308 family)
MIRLAMLLVGARVLRRKWRALVVLGALWMALGFAIMVDASNGLDVVAVETLAILLLFEGFLALALFTLAPHRRGYTVLVKALALVVLGCMILDFPVQVDIENSLLFGLAFLIDGASRIATASVVRFPKWQLVAAGGALELGLGAFVISDWPVGYHNTVPFCIGVALLLSGWTILRIGLRLRQLKDDTPVVNLPVFEHRGWHGLGSALPPARPTAPTHHATPLIVHVWTPVGSAASPRSAHRLLIDRYIAAIDGKGMISTGHAALELPPDLYISHYPVLDLDHSPEEFARLFRATPDNNVKGHFQPSYAFESADWCPADAHVYFHMYDAARLRAHWEAYRADDTYNLTNRNCSVAVAAALEAALEGTLGTGAGWGRFWRLLVNPDLWVAALLRARAESMTWTPGLVLDYARALDALVDPQRRPWRRRLQVALRHLRRRHGTMAKRPA